MAALVTRIEPHRRDNDCAVWALSIFLGIPYEDVWAVVLQLDRGKGKDGLWPRTVCRIAAELGHPLQRLTTAPTGAYGILIVENRREGHMAMLRNGLVFEPDATAWDLDHWLETHKYRVKGILVLK